MISRFLSLLLYVSLVVVSIGVSASAAIKYSTLTRGTEPAHTSTPKMLGTNTALEIYSDEAELQSALHLIKSARLTIIRQHFPWREIESKRGDFDWAKWDRITAAARAGGLQIVAVLDTAPEWAQRGNERDLPSAPPDDFAEFAKFAGEFARRYASQLDYYQVWDEPNVHPSWGRRNADPAEYAKLLHLAALSIRSNDPNAVIVLAGLGMNLETQRPHPDYSEILFLRGLYEAGAQADFDVVAGKPYGMWSGPEDRRTSSSVLDFSRLILLREEMKQHGDAAKPVWAVEMGWNALPSDWTGPPSPWGSDTETVQADRLTRALARAQVEWGWAGALFPNAFQPDVPPDDPRTGFALVTPNFQPRAFYTALASFASNPPPVPASPASPWVPITFLSGVIVFSGWRALRLVSGTPLESWWARLRARFCALPEIFQLTGLACGVAVFYFSPSTPLTLVVLVLLVPLVALRLDLGLALLVFSIPFFLYPKTLFAGFELSLVEVLSIVCAAAWAWMLVITPNRMPTIMRNWGLRRVTTLDWAIVAFVVSGIVSTRVASNFGVASREFRVIVAEPALLYGLLRVAGLTRAQLMRLVDALILGGAAVCLVGLGQFATGDLIVGEGLRRVRAVWGSPNNAALFIGRLVPLALAMTLYLRDPRRRWLYAALTLLLAGTLYLTYSLGSLLFGVPAGVALVAFAWLWPNRGRLRAWHFAALGGIVVGVILLIALAGGQRLQSLFQTGTGTGFFRVAVWSSAVHMISDHPVFGVGLDNFLYEYPKYILPEAWREPNLSHPHNVILDFWVRMGIPGLAVLIWIEIEFFRRAWHSFRQGDHLGRALAIGLMASMVDFLAHGMVDAAYFVVDLAFVFMLTIGLAASSSELKGRETPAVENRLEVSV